MTDYMWRPLLTMCLAAHLAPKPDKQVRRLAKKYRKKCPPLAADAAHTLDAIIRSSAPASLVLRTYDLVTRDGE